MRLITVFILTTALSSLAAAAVLAPGKSMLVCAVDPSILNQVLARDSFQTNGNGGVNASIFYEGSEERYIIKSDQGRNPITISAPFQASSITSYLAANGTTQLCALVSK